MPKQVRHDNLVWVWHVPPPFIVIARLGKAEAIQYNLFNHYINVFIRNNYQTGLLRSARNDAGGDRPDYFAPLAMTREG